LLSNSVEVEDVRHPNFLDGVLCCEAIGPMAIDSKDIAELQKALNDAAGKASVLWTTFVIFQLYIAIAFGSVTHRDLFLETPIKLPLLNVDLPLTGFFAVAPTLLVILHFYVFLQLLGLATKANDYNKLLVSQAPGELDRRYLRQRLDVFPILQFLAGPRDQRTGFRGLSLRLIAWITLVGTPLLILLQGQVTFLPYHREWIVWLQRGVVLIDLGVIWYFWIQIRSDDDSIVNRARGKVWMCLGAGISFCVVIFSTYLAVFPGEWLEDRLPELHYVPTTWWPDWSKKEDWTSLDELLFRGQVDAVSGRPRSMFSNRLVLIDQNFIVDPNKLGQVDFSHSFRGRDLRGAVLNRADLRKADFSGAMLKGSQFDGANLRNALFGCVIPRQLRFVQPAVGCVQLQDASFAFAELQGASLEGAQLQGASFDFAHLQGASLKNAKLQGASFFLTDLRGASFELALLKGASFLADLQGASLEEAQLQGAVLAGALQGASLQKAQLQGSLLTGYVWRARGTPALDLTRFRDIDTDTKLSEETRDAIANYIPAGSRRDSFLAATAKEPQVDVLDAAFWDNAHSSQPKGEESERRLAAFLADLACSTKEEASPYVARRLLQSLREMPRSTQQLFTDQLRKGKSDRTACPGVNDFSDDDWAWVDRVVADAQRLAPDENAK
jgi:uncharacterized protein YjbI with pentapeptide repeats